MFRLLASRVTVALVSLSVVLPAKAGIDEAEAAFAARDWRVAAREAQALDAQGNNLGSCLLGQLYRAGDGVPKDGPRARSLLSKCSQGEVVMPDGTVMLARMLMSGERGPRDAAHAESLLRPMLRYRHAGVQLAYAMWLAQDWDGVARPSDARALVNQYVDVAARLGMTETYYFMGDFYRAALNEAGVRREVLNKEAVSWFRRGATEQNSRYALDAYLEITGLRARMPDALFGLVLQKLGTAAVQGTLAARYLSGRGVPRDPVEARFWAEFGSRADDSAALRVIGELHRRGEGGLSRDGAKAIDYLTRAHARGDQWAAGLLAQTYYEGQLMPQDITLARRWLQTGYDSADPQNRDEYGTTLREFDDLKAQADSWAKQRASQQGWTGDAIVLAAIAVFGAALIAGRMGSGRSVGSAADIVVDSKVTVPRGFEQVEQIKILQDNFEFFDSLKKIK